MLWNIADFQTLPLTAAECRAANLPAGLMSTRAIDLFPGARDPKAALAGLLLLYGHWGASHQISQDVYSVEGSYWHAIAHRIEPDSQNAAYWFRRVGVHPIFKALYVDAQSCLSSSKTGWRLRNEWDPYLFIQWCNEARNQPGSEKERVARRLQRLECAHLFTWCTMKIKGLLPESA